MNSVFVLVEKLSDEEYDVPPWEEIVGVFATETAIQDFMRANYLTISRKRLAELISNHDVVLSEDNELIWKGLDDTRYIWGFKITSFELRGI